MANTMASEQLARPTRARAAGMALALPPWYRLALAGILLLAAGLNFFWLTREGYSNTYYAATVKSMLTG